MVVPGLAAVALVFCQLDAGAAAIGPPAFPQSAPGPSDTAAGPGKTAVDVASPADERAATDCGPEQVATAMRDLFSARARTAAREERGRAAIVPATGRRRGVVRSPHPVERTPHGLVHGPRAGSVPDAGGDCRSARSGPFDPSVAVRAVALPALVQAGASDTVAAIVSNVREFDWMRTEALRALVDGGRPPDQRYLAWLRGHSGPLLNRMARYFLAGQPSTPGRGRGGAIGRHATETEANPRRAERARSAADIPAGTGATASPGLVTAGKTRRPQ